MAEHTVPRCSKRAWLDMRDHVAQFLMSGLGVNTGVQISTALQYIQRHSVLVVLEPRGLIWIPRVQVQWAITKLTAPDQVRCIDGVIGGPDFTVTVAC